MANAMEHLVILQRNLRNVEATFGKSSTQYLDILEMVDAYMTNMNLKPKAIEAPLPDSQTLQHSFTNLVFRPKQG